MGRLKHNQHVLFSDSDRHSFPTCRSHRVILEVPSQQFYSGALEERADRRQTEYLAAWERMPHTPRGDAFPLMIVGE